MAQLQEPKFLLVAMTGGRRAEAQAQVRKAAEEAAREARKPGNWLEEGEEEAEQATRKRQERDEDSRGFRAWG